MTDVSATQLSQIRSLSQEDNLHLSIYQPSVVLACQVNNASIAKGARTIAYDTVSSGSYANIVSGETLLVGSVAGASDLGRVRVKSATSNTLTVAENSDVRWANDVYLTVLKLVEILPVFPRIISDPNNAENTIWYKDYDIAYSNQNSILGSFVCMGPHRAGVLNDSGQCQFYWSASGTSHVNGDTLTYSWDFEGADTVTGSTSATPGYITYKTPGHFLQKLTVTSSGGSVDNSYRYVSVYPQGYEKAVGSNLTDYWTLSGGQGSRGSGGYVATVSIKNPLKFTPYDGAPVVVFGDHRYNGVQASIGGAENTSDIFFVGYILSGSIRWDYEKSTVEFQVGSPTEMMKLTNGFSVSLENSTVPAYWYEIKLNSIKKATYHFLRWHSTVLLTNDLQFLATDFYVKFFDTNRESLYDAIQNVLQSSLMAELVSNRQGKLWIETSMAATPSAKTVYPQKFVLSKSDWRNEPNITEVKYNPISYIELGGVVCNPYSNADNANVALLACAPGSAPSTHGKVESPTGLALTSQTQLNTLVGNVFASKNAKFPRISYELIGSYLNLDIAPLEGIGTNIAADDTVKNLAISGSYFVDNYKFDYDGQNQYLKVGVDLAEITEGVAGDTIIIPANPSTIVPGFSNPVFNIPSFTYPKIVFPTFPGQVTPQLVTSSLVILVTGYGVYYADYKATPLSWKSANDSFSLADKAALTRIEVSSTGKIFAATSKQIWSLLPPYSANAIATSPIEFPLPTTYTIRAMGINPVNGQLCVMSNRGYPVHTTVFYSNVGGSGLIDRTTYGELGYEYPGNFTFYAGKWYLTYGREVTQASHLVVMDEGLSTIENNYTIPGTIAYGFCHEHALSADYIYTQDPPFLYTDAGATQVRAIADDGFVDGQRQKTVCDPTGQFVAQIRTTGVWFSSDFGANFTQNATITGNNFSNGKVMNMGDQYKWIVAFNDTTASPGPTTRMWYTNDAGLTWTDYMANLLSIGVPSNGTIAAIRSF